MHRRATEHLYTQLRVADVQVVSGMVWLCFFPFITELNGRNENVDKPLKWRVPLSSRARAERQSSSALVECIRAVFVGRTWSLAGRPASRLASKASCKYSTFEESE